MNYTTLGVINSSPQEYILSHSPNLSQVLIAEPQMSSDNIVMGVLPKYSSKYSLEKQEDSQETNCITNTDNRTRNERKIKLNFSVDRLLGIDSVAHDHAGEKSEHLVIDRTNCALGDLDNCSISYDCCKYESATHCGVNGFVSCNPGLEMISIVRPLPIRIANSINAVLKSQPIASPFNGLSPIFKIHTNSHPPSNTSCINSLKLQTTTPQFHHNLSQPDNTLSTKTTSTSSSTSKRKRSWSRAVFSNLQRKGLEIQFQQQKYITKPDRRKLAARLNLTDAQVKVWFQNRRMKWRHTRENLKTGQEKPMENLTKCNEEGNSSSDDEIDVVAE